MSRAASLWIGPDGWGRLVRVEDDGKGNVTAWDADGREVCLSERDHERAIEALDDQNDDGARLDSAIAGGCA